MSHICQACGQKARSRPQLNRFHALMEAAYQNWPDTHEFRPKDKEHLRKWLVIKAGFGVAKEIRLEGWMPRNDTIMDLLGLTIEAAIQAAGAHPFVEVYPDKVIVTSAESISYKTSHSKACEIFRAVDEVLEIETGTSADDLLNAMAGAA